MKDKSKVLKTYGICSINCNLLLKALKCEAHINTAEVVFTRY